MGSSQSSLLLINPYSAALFGIFNPLIVLNLASDKTPIFLKSREKFSSVRVKNRKIYLYSVMNIQKSL